MGNKAWVVFHKQNSENILIKVFFNEVNAKVFLADYVLNKAYRFLDTNDLRLIEVDVE